MAAAAEARGGDFPVGMKVLVVDDDPTCLLVLKRMLDDCKYDVTTCPQATRALTMLQENRRGFDVLISDVHMPDMDGFRLLELVGLEMDLPVILMSADSSTNTVMKGIKHGACDYLIKPVKMEELRNIWQHVVRKGWSENVDHEHSGSMDDTDRNRPTNNENEYASSANDVGDGNWKSQKKKLEKEEDEGDENGHPSSTSKKPRVVWSVELHQQFVNAVNHLGIDKAVPSKILELMNVPGLTRENVASHLQKFRLYLKRIAQHHAGIPHPFVPSASSAKVAPLGGLELQALAATGQIPPQALAALQDELRGRPTSSLALPGRDQSSLRLAAIKGNKPHGETEIAFGQPIYKCPKNAYGAFPRSNPAVGGMPPFAAWPNNKLGMPDSGNTLGSLNNSQNSNMLLQELQQQPDNMLSGTLHSIDVKPSGLVVPPHSLNTFPASDGLSHNLNPLVMPPQSSGFMGAIPRSMKREPLLTTSQPSGSMLGGIDLVTQASTSQPLISTNGGNLPSLMNRSSNLMSSQGISNFQGGNNPYVANQNAVGVGSKPQGVLKTESTDSLRHSYGYIGGSTSMDFGLLSQSKSPQFGLLQNPDYVTGSWSSLQNIDSYGGTLGPGQSVNSNVCCNGNGNGGGFGGDDDDSDEIDEFPQGSKSSMSTLLGELTDESYWKGLDEVTSGRRCLHGIVPRKEVIYNGPDAGWRFYGCHLDDDMEKCMYTDFVDGPWPQRVQRMLKKFSGLALKNANSLSVCRMELHNARKGWELAVAQRNALAQLKEREVRAANAMVSHAWMMVVFVIAVILLGMILNSKN